MERLLALALGLFALGASQAPVQALVGRRVDATVVRIADGDSLEISLVGDKHRIRVRLEGVDAPELGEAFSRQAQTFTRILLLDQRVRVEGRDVDRYGRLVARVLVSGKDASLELLRAGLACHRFASDAVLAGAESRARQAGAGFWAANAQKPQCVARTRKKSQEL